jgi:hypothetical protein
MFWTQRGEWIIAIYIRSGLVAGFRASHSNQPVKGRLIFELT